jgi:hypothetical protein
LATSRNFSVIGSPFIGAAHFTSDTWTSPGDLRLFVNPNVNPLPPFAMYAAFPRADYYGGSDTTVFHWLAARLQTVVSRVHRDRLYETM